jgi:microcystin-dependent protein
LGTRIKSFDSTGVAPNGRLFAPDLNAIQDQYADALNLSQAIRVGSIAFGETGLQLLRYGAGEMRLSGALRTDGVVRALGGLFAGTFTTTQRDAIPAGQTPQQRPFGLVIFNTTTNRLEINVGTDAAPNWQPVGPTATEVPIGSVMDWSWAAASIPSWALLPFGQSLLKASYPALDAIANAAAYVYGTDATHFSLPDYRGRIGVGKDDMGGTSANRITVAISGVSGATLGAVFGAEGITLTTAQLPAHSHNITGTPGHNLTLPDHAHSGIIVPSGPATGGGSPSANTPTATANTGGVTSSPAINGGITLGSLAISNTGSGNVVLNSQPSIIVNKIMRAL